VHTVQSLSDLALIS